MQNLHSDFVTLNYDIAWQNYVNRFCFAELILTVDNVLSGHFMLFITFDIILEHLMRIAILENTELEIEFHH